MDGRPRTLQEAIVYFSDPGNCLDYFVKRRWPNGIACAICGSRDVGFIKSRRMFQCKNRHSHAQFSVKVGTIFEDSSIGLDKWLLAMWMLANGNGSVSSYEIHRTIGVSQKTAWYMLHRLRLALQEEGEGNLLNELPAGEAFLSGT
jgi:hypothetical protein